ncbi:MAG: O-sialoglycoprotein endopeptidase [Clostridia bacterium]|nr:O-sialoglycoprotein endopeptidase [Clostridia bacterium]
MKDERLVIGVDTSCYTTSVAAKCGGRMFHFKKMLDVEEGECGLRQSDALFQHVKNLPLLFDELKNSVKIRDFDDVTVAVSSKPRNVEGSYMPVFLAGQSFAKTVAAVLGAKYIETSHQDGHIMAAIYSCKKYDILSEPFLVYHLSGGTTELLLAQKTENGFACEIVGGTRDLPAGQFIDRIGVRLGFDFPCGRYLDYSAENYSGKQTPVKTCVNDSYINFSGEETRYRRHLENGEDKEKIAYCVMKCIAESVRKSVEFAKKKYGIKNVLMVGGVSSSKVLRCEFLDMPNVYFAEAEFSTDNAVGVCEIGAAASGTLR